MILGPFRGDSRVIFGRSRHVLVKPAAPSDRYEVSKRCGSARSSSRELRRSAAPTSRREKISTSQGPSKPCASTAARSFRISITPSPIMPRSSSRSRVGTSQSQMWKAWMRLLPLPARSAPADVRVPPDVIDVDRDAEPSRAVGVERVADVERLAERVHAGAVGGIHRMQRLDRERRRRRRSHSRAARAIASSTCVARARDVLRRRRAGPRELRQAADDEDQARRAERRRLVDGAAIVVEHLGVGATRRPGTCRRGNSRKGESRRRERLCTARSRPTAST